MELLLYAQLSRWVQFLSKHKQQKGVEVMLSHFQMVVKDDCCPLVYRTCTRDVQLWPGSYHMGGAQGFRGQ